MLSLRGYLWEKFLKVKGKVDLNYVHKTVRLPWKRNACVRQRKCCVSVNRDRYADVEVHLKDNRL